MATNDHTYLVNLNQASGTGSGGNKCLNDVLPNACQSFGFVYPCNDLLVTEKLEWNDPPGSCTTGPDTDCYWSNIVYERSAGLGWNAGVLAGTGNQVTLSTNMGYTEWWTDSVGQAGQNGQGLGPWSDGTYSYVAPSPPGLAYDYAPASPPPARRRQLEDLEHDVEHEVQTLRHKQLAEARNIVSYLGVIINGSWANNARNESYRSMTLDLWHTHLRDELQPRWDREVHALRASHGRALQVVWRDEVPPPTPPSPPPQLYDGPEWTTVEESYSNPATVFVDEFGEHISTAVEVLAHEVNASYYQIQIYLSSRSAALATLAGITDAFLAHIDLHTGLNSHLAVTPTHHARFLCNGSLMPPSPPPPVYNVLDDCTSPSELITTLDDCEHAAHVVGHPFVPVGGGTGCQVLNDVLVTWGGAATAAEAAHCGQTSCIADNGAGVGCVGVQCICTG